MRQCIISLQGGMGPMGPQGPMGPVGQPGSVGPPVSLLHPIIRFRIIISILFAFLHGNDRTSQPTSVSMYG